MQVVQYALDHFKQQATRTTEYSTALVTKGTTQFHLENLDEAIKYCSQAYQINQTINSSDIQNKTCHCLYNTYKAKGAHEKALIYHEELGAIKDKIQNSNLSNEILRLQLNYLYSEEKLSDSLNNKKNIALLELGYEQELGQRTQVIFFVFILLCLFIIGLFGLGTAYRKNQHQKQKLELQKEALEELNKLNKQIFSIFSHDFKGSLMTMNFMLTGLEKTHLLEGNINHYTKDIILDCLTIILLLQEV